MSNEPRTLDETWTLLEEKLDGLATRHKDLASENQRLKAAVIEISAERDRLRKEIADARELLARFEESASKTSRYELERDEVKSRIEKLIQSLEAVEVAGADA